MKVMMQQEIQTHGNPSINLPENGKEVHYKVRMHHAMWKLNVTDPVCKIARGGQTWPGDLRVVAGVVWFPCWFMICAGEELGNHLKFVGTDLWTREPRGTCRNQVGTNLEMDFRLFCGLWCFWMLFDPCPGNLILWLYLVGVLQGICEFELKTLFERSWKNVFRTLVK